MCPFSRTGAQVAIIHLFQYEWGLLDILISAAEQFNFSQTKLVSIQNLNLFIRFSIALGGGMHGELKR